MERIEILFMVAILVVIIVDFTHTYFVKTNAEVIKIQDVKMQVYKRRSRVNNPGALEVPTYKFILKDLESNHIGDEVYVDPQVFEQYKSGDEIELKKVYYKLKDKIYYEIAFSSEIQERELQEFEKNNDENVDLLISETKKIRKMSTHIYTTVVFMILLGLFGVTVLNSLINS